MTIVFYKMYNHTDLCLKSSLSSERKAKREHEVKTIGTHSGRFTCDEVLACYMLKVLPEYKDARYNVMLYAKSLASSPGHSHVFNVLDLGTRLLNHYYEISMKVTCRDMAVQKNTQAKDTELAIQLGMMPDTQLYIAIFFVTLKI
jgi:hypothetical protein